MLASPAADVGAPAARATQRSQESVQRVSLRLCFKQPDPNDNFSLKPAPIQAPLNGTLLTHPLQDVPVRVSFRSLPHVCSQLLTTSGAPVSRCSSLRPLKRKRTITNDFSQPPSKRRLTQAANPSGKHSDLNPRTLSRLQTGLTCAMCAILFLSSFSSG